MADIDGKGRGDDSHDELDAASDLTRRELIRRSAKAAGIIAAAGGFAWAVPVVEAVGNAPPTSRRAGPARTEGTTASTVPLEGGGCCSCANALCGCIQVMTPEECGIYCADPAYDGLAEILGTVSSHRRDCGAPVFRPGQSCRDGRCA